MKKATTFYFEFVGEDPEYGSRMIEALSYKTEGDFIIMETAEYGIVNVNLKAVKLFRMEKEQKK